MHAQAGGELVSRSSRSRDASARSAAAGAAASRPERRSRDRCLSAKARRDRPRPCQDSGWGVRGGVAGNRNALSRKPEKSRRAHLLLLLLLRPRPEPRCCCCCCSPARRFASSAAAAPPPAPQSAEASHFTSGQNRPGDLSEPALLCRPLSAHSAVNNPEQGRSRPPIKRLW